jgi:hypothetical protein
MLLQSVVVISVNTLFAQECSTEKVNKSCIVTIDRSYPVALPTIQMRKGQVVQVIIKNPLPFETLTLDLQTAQALAGTDQTAGFVTGALPQLKGALVQTTFAQKFVAENQIQAIDGGSEPKIVTEYKNAYEQFNADLISFVDDVSSVYAQLNEAIGPISPTALSDKTTRQADSIVKGNVPIPWNPRQYQEWKGYLICEMTGETCKLFQFDKSPPPGMYLKTDLPAIKPLLARAALLSNKTATPCPTTRPPVLPLACYIVDIQEEVAKLTPPEQNKFADYLKTLDRDSATIAADNTSIAALVKDLGTYYANVKASQNMASMDPINLGAIPDPLDEKNERNTNLARFLGRQAVFSVNSVNEVATFAASVPGSSAKKSVLTITVLYADPIFEASAGVFFSTLANRSFANLTKVSGDPPVQGDVVITQTVSRPTIVPYAGANWRVLPTFAWPDKRRGAIYLTGAVGLNANNALVEFGAGPSISWRAVMFSALYHWGHDVRLTQGEYEGQIWCNQTTAHDNIPKCSGSPPAPSTEKYWRGAFGLGVSVRVPSLFSAAGK